MIYQYRLVKRSVGTPTSATDRGWCTTGAPSPATQFPSIYKTVKHRNCIFSQIGASIYKTVKH
jgi:hypothetical protein